MPLSDPYLDERFRCAEQHQLDWLGAAGAHIVVAMAYLTRARGWREAAATLWFCCCAAGLLATSAPNDEYGPGGTPIVWSGPGPVVVLSDEVAERAFMVTLLVPRTDAATWQPPSGARVSLSVTAEHFGSEIPVAGGEAGAGGVEEPHGTPWITATLRDSLLADPVLGNPALATLLESGPFLTDYTGVASVPFAGDCDDPNPGGRDPCRLSFTVAFERSPSGNPEAETKLSWSLDLDPGISSAEPETDLVLSVEIEPL